jgi:hypothetical protein
MQQMDGNRGVEHDRFERRLGIQKAVWYLAGTPLGDLLIGYLEIDDLRRATELLSRSRDDFNLWFNAGLRDATGIDLTAGEQISLPELLCSWTARGEPTPSISSGSVPLHRQQERSTS